MSPLGRYGAASPKVRLAPILARLDFKRPFVQLNAVCHTRSRLNHYPPRNHICTSWSEVCSYKWFALSWFGGSVRESNPDVRFLSHGE